MESEIYSAIDANINRSIEGLRVCEDIFRFIARDNTLSVKLKAARHAIAEGSRQFPESRLLSGRDVENDSQKYVDLKKEKTRESMNDILRSNLHRSTEALRSIEEFFKLLHPGAEENPFQKIRFSLYSLEKDMISALLREDKRKFFHNSLYAILDSSFVQDGQYLKTANRLIDGGASVIQLRMKNHPMREILKTAREVSSVCSKNGVLFIVNDYPGIVSLTDAGGVHLGQDDFPVNDVRSILPVDRIIGLSTHSLEQAKAGIVHKPDYIAIGPMYDTKTKNNQLLQGLGENYITEIMKDMEIPVVAIGGLNPERISLLKKSGCSCFAVVSYLYQNNKIEENCREIINSLQLC